MIYKAPKSQKESGRIKKESGRYVYNNNKDVYFISSFRIKALNIGISQNLTS